VVFYYLFVVFKIHIPRNIIFYLFYHVCFCFIDVLLPVSKSTTILYLPSSQDSSSNTRLYKEPNISIEANLISDNTFILSENSTSISSSYMFRPLSEYSINLISSSLPIIFYFNNYLNIL